MIFDGCMCCGSIPDNPRIGDNDECYSLALFS